MASEEKIVNKIIPVDTIIEIANYLEDQREEYKRLIESDKQKNLNLSIKEQVYEYKSATEPKVNYSIRFKDGREITQTDYNWFVGNLNNIKFIDKITLYSDINYSTNAKDKQHYEYMRLWTWVNFTEDIATLRVEGKNVEEQAYKVHSYLKGTIENNDDRYNKTVKNRKIRMQSFTFSIGFVLSYILYFILLANKEKLPANIVSYLDNKIILIIGQWVVACLLGNIVGFPIMMGFYRNILPKAKYSHYSKTAHRKVYVDNLQDYISHNEVQIGKFTDNGKNREKIEKIYKITSKIILVQLAISILLFFIMK